MSFIKVQSKTKRDWIKKINRKNDTDRSVETV